MAEWNHNKRWNPFNSYKLLAHVDEWSKIKRGATIPAPILVTVDPSNICNLNCKWCNAAYIREKNKQMLSEKMMLQIADYLPYWNSQPLSRRGVEAVCIAGGGEPLTNPHVGTFIDRLIKNGIEVGVVTNGILIDRFIEPLSKCTWVGVSIDAGTAEIYEKCKGSNRYYEVLKNIKTLVQYSKEHKTLLGSDFPAHGVSWKYLLCNDNIGEIYSAAEKAKEIGCKNIHFRPSGASWDKLEQEILFTKQDINTFNAWLERAMLLDCPEFGVFGITHKFGDQFQRANHFSKCYAAFMTAVFQPPTDDSQPVDCFTLGLCCDRRGDRRTELLHNCDEVFAINHAWGSDEHWKIHDLIKVEECPRCTYQPHNEIYENVILRDSMTHRFI